MDASKPENTGSCGGTRGAFYLTGGCVFAFCMLVMPDICAAAASRAAVFCVEKLIPSLFPLMALNGVILGAGGAAAAAKTAGPALHRAFRLPEVFCAPFFIGLLSGFPSGAAAVAKIRGERGCSKEQAERGVAAVSNSGIAYAAAVGGMLGDMRAGVLIFVSQVVCSLLASRFLFRGLSGSYPIRNGESGAGTRGLLIRSVKEAVVPMLNVCAFIIFFAPVSALVGRAAELMRLPDAAKCLLLSLVEMTNAAAAAADSLPLPDAAAVCAFAVSWSGVCVAAQVCSATDGEGLSMKYYFRAKLICGAVSALAVRAAAVLIF